MSSLFSFSDQEYVSKNVIDQTGISYITAVEETYDGGLLIAGSITNYGGITGRNYLIKVTQDGVIDNQFVSNSTDGSKFNGIINCVKQLFDNSILIAGNFTNYNGVTGRSYLIKLNSDGTLNTAFTDNVTTDSTIGNFKFGGQIYSLDVQSDGKIVIVGAFGNYDNRQNRDGLIRLNSDGTTDNTFNFVEDGPFIKNLTAIVTTTIGSSIATTTFDIFYFNIGLEIKGSIPVDPFYGMFPSGTYIEDIYTIGSTKYIKFSNNALFSGNSIITPSNEFNYVMKGSTVSGSNEISLDSYRYFNSISKTISGQPYIWFKLEPDDVLEDKYSRYIGKKVYNGGFSTGIDIVAGYPNFNLKYEGVEIIDGERYYKFNVASNAATNSNGATLIGGRTTSIRGLSSTTVYISDSLGIAGSFLSIGQTILPLNPSSSTPFGTGVSAKITNITYTTSPIPGPGYIITVDKPVTVSGTFYSVMLGESPIPVYTKQNSIFKTSGNFPSSSIGCVQFQNQISRNKISTVDIANATGTILLRSYKKFSSILHFVKINPLDDSIFIAFKSNYNGNTQTSNIIKLSSSGILDRQFSSGILTFNPNPDYFNIPPVASLDFIDNNTNLIVAGNFFNYGGAIVNNCLIKISTTSGSYDLPFAYEITDNFGNDFLDPEFGDQLWCALTSVCVQYDPISNQEKIYPSGFFQDLGYGGSTGRLYIVRLNSDGSVDSNFCTTLIDGKINNGVAIKTAIGRVVKGNISNSFYIIGILNDDYFKQFNKYSTVLNKS